jgi:hypothetical protein
MDRYLDDIQHAYDKEIQVPGKELAFLILIAFLASFGFIRGSAHMIKAQVSWWPGNVETKGGTHIHHLVWGILLMMAFGYVGIAIADGSPWEEIAAILFGIGMGLTLDEFALWLNLQDVYWSQKGRQSIDAVIVAAALIIITLLGLSFWIEIWKAGLVLFGLSSHGPAAADAGRLYVPWHVVGLLLAVPSFLKGKWMTAVFGVVIPIVAIVGALRLAKPGSWWARRYYDEQKLTRARKRFKGDDVDAADEPAAPAPPQPEPSGV